MSDTQHQNNTVRKSDIVEDKRELSELLNRLLRRRGGIPLVLTELASTAFVIEQQESQFAIDVQRYEHESKSAEELRALWLNSQPMFFSEEALRVEPSDKDKQIEKLSIDIEVFKKANAILEGQRDYYQQRHSDRLVYVVADIQAKINELEKAASQPGGKSETQLITEERTLVRARNALDFLVSLNAEREKERSNDGK